MIVLKIAWRNIRRNGKRSLITIVSVFIAVFLALIIRSMQLGMYNNVIKNVAGNYTGYLQIHAKGYWNDRNLDNTLVLTDTLVAQIERVKGVEAYAPRLESFALASGLHKSKAVMINGVDVEKEKPVKPLSERLVSGRSFSLGKPEVIIGKGLARFFNIRSGDTLYLIGQGYHGMSAAGKYNVCGIIDLHNRDLNNLSVFMSLYRLQDYLSAPGLVTGLVLTKNNTADVESIKRRLLRNIDSTAYEVMTWKEMMPELHQAIVADNVGGLYMVFILYMVITFGIFSTVLMMTRERIFELGILTAIGMKKNLLMLIMAVETFILSLTGVIAGVIAAYPVMYYFHIHPFPLPGDKAEMMEKFGFLPVIPFSIDFNIIYTHALIIFCISLVIVLYPVITIARLHSLQAMHKK